MNAVCGQLKQYLEKGGRHYTVLFLLLPNVCCLMSQAQPDECSVCGKLKQYLEKGGRHYTVFMKVPGLAAGKERYIPGTLIHVICDVNGIPDQDEDSCVVTCFLTGFNHLITLKERASGAVVSASDSNARGSGFQPRQGQGFSSSYETPKLLGAGDSHVLRMRR
jgi:hypothetical protein